ncbi:MAG: hypothetical protein M3Q08_04105, partial [Pseudomonadota bacterium]|nr:hypothetical protein [Pseudomonadota bacterium]
MIAKLRLGSIRFTRSTFTVIGCGATPAPSKPLAAQPGRCHFGRVKWLLGIVLILAVALGAFYALVAPP